MLGYTHPRQQTPQEQTTPCAVHAGRYGHQASGMHPTGMHTCLFDFLDIFLTDQNENGERRLINDLLSDYDPRVRPISNMSLPVDVHILFMPSRIESLVNICARAHVCVCVNVPILFNKNGFSIFFSTKVLFTKISYI